MRIELLAGFLFLTGCTGNIILHAVYEAGPEPQIYFCPRENCSDIFRRLTLNVTTIDCALFDISSKTFLSILKEKKARVFVDNKNAPKLTGLGLNLKMDQTDALSHNKFCVLDHEIVWTGSFNPTIEGERNTRNNVIIIHSNYLAANYEDEFNELWDSSGIRPVRYPMVYLNNQLYENYFCPEDCRLGVKEVIKLLGKANESVYFMTYSFTDKEIADALILAKNRGIDVSGVFEKSQESKYSQYQRLKGAGCKVRFDNKVGLMHHKVFIIDRRIVITGSWNPTASGTEKNDENILIIHDAKVARQYLSEFYRLYGD